MARLRDGEKFYNQGLLHRLLFRHFGLRESEISSELGWQRRTVNNYLRNLKEKGLAYKEGRNWYSDDW